MSDTALAPIFTVTLLATLVLWVPAITAAHKLYLRLRRRYTERKQGRESPALDLIERA